MNLVPPNDDSPLVWAIEKSKNEFDPYIYFLIYFINFERKLYLPFQSSSEL